MKGTLVRVSDNPWPTTMFFSWSLSAKCWFCSTAESLFLHAFLVWTLLSIRHLTVLSVSLAMMNHEIYSHVRLQRCYCIDEKMLHVLSCILLFCLDSSLVSCFQPNLLSHFCCFTLLEMFEINICFIVLVSISSKYLFVCFHCRGSSDDYKLQQYDGSNTPMIPKYLSLWWSLLYPLRLFVLNQNYYPCVYSHTDLK